MQLTKQGVRNLDLVRVKRPIPICNGRVGCTPSKWKTEGIYPNAAFEQPDDLEPPWRAGTVEVRRCLCCDRRLEERNRILDL